MPTGKIAGIFSGMPKLKSVRRRIELTRDRAYELAEKYQRPGESLPETVQRLMERYDVMESVSGRSVPPTNHEPATNPTA